MASSTAPRSRRSLRSALAAVLAAALLAPAAATARQFSSGSLIIPASIEYQTDNGILGTYALVYLTLLKNASLSRKITFYWAVEPRKLSQYRCDTASSVLPDYSAFNDNDGCDFYVSRSAGQPVSFVNPDGTLTAPFDISSIAYVPTVGPARGTSKKGATFETIDATKTVTKYLGGVWIVDATDRAAFLKLLATEPTLARFHANGSGLTNPNYVNIHSANANFEAPIVSITADRPPLVAATGGSELSFVENVLANAGLCQPDTIPNCAGTYSAAGLTPGVVYDVYPSASSLLDPATGCAGGLLNCTIGTTTQTYGVFWGAGATGGVSAQAAANLAAFADVKGNVAFAQYDTIWDVENALSTGTFQTTSGIQQYAPDVASAEDCNDATLSPSAKFYSAGGDCLVLGGANQPWAQTGNFVFDGGQGSFKAFQLNTGGAFDVGVTQVLRVKSAGVLGPTVSSAINKDNDPEKGLILYLSGHKFDNGRLWGERLILNTLFNHLGVANTEFARSEPVGYVDDRVTPNTQRVYQGTYVQLPPPDTSSVMTYNPAAAQMWKFPFTAGHLYEYDLSKISTVDQSFNSVGGNGAGIDWDAAATLTLNRRGFMTPEPPNRKIYTYVNGSANLGWKRIPFDETQTQSSCWDGNGNGKCDLSEMLAAGVSAGITTAALKAKNASDPAQALTLALLVSQVRGHCSAHASPKITGTPIPRPGDGDCDSTTQKNRATLGGVDHSTPAVVGPSRYMATDAKYSSRPVVIYAGGRDGMLHAFYVSGGSSTWTDEWGDALPANVVRGQELWAIVPPTQVPKLASNSAMVDGTINVVDVFGDFPYDRNGDGVIDWSPSTNADTNERPNGTRRWRTVLIASAGEGDSELFALDVTSPVHPVLLWHVSGAVEKDNRWDANGNGVFDPGLADTFSRGLANPDPANPSTYGDPKTYALKWSDGTSVDYLTTDNAKIWAMKRGRYNYKNLGKTYSTAVAKIWAGSGFQYTLFVATNAEEGKRGAEVFAIDLITGQKQWQWEHLYDGDGYVPGTGVDNGLPPRMALGDIDANGSTERIYVGDLEGHVWELYARDGRNVNFLKGKTGSSEAYHSFPLFGTAQMTGADADPAADAITTALYELSGSPRATGLSQQPLTTPIGQGRFTAVPTGKGNYLLGRLALVVGTMGVDWSIAPFEKGHLFVLPVHPDQGTRLTEPIEMGATRDPMKMGILDEAAAWDIPLGVGERVYGMPRVVNNQIIFNTAFGSFSGDITLTAADPGNLWMVGASATGTTTTTTGTNGAKSFGGVVVVGSDVVVTTDQGIKKMDKPPDVAGGGVGTSTFNRSTPAVMKSWEVVP